MDNTSPSTKRQKIVDDDKGVEEALRETLSLPMCSTRSSSKRRQVNEGSKGIMLLVTYLIIFIIMF
jgi:hypothetical protein